MALIPAGSFTMGDPLGDEYPKQYGKYYEQPTHAVNVSAFYMDRYLVTKGLWDTVQTWAATNGYGFENPGLGKAPNHPVHTLNWWDAVKWCNARSQKEGLTPCYFTGAGLTNVYRTGRATPSVQWNASGYRLPTEAEWEKAARGGSSGHRFPWTDVDTITHNQANYYSYLTIWDISSTRGYHPTYNDGVFPYTSPVGSFAANGYGLYDMAGNLSQWCWDWADGLWYGKPGALVDDTRGPDWGTERVTRGGNWDGLAADARCASRDLFYEPMYAIKLLGFRCVKGH